MHPRNHPQGHGPACAQKALEGTIFAREAGTQMDQANKKGARERERERERERGEAPALQIGGGRSGDRRNNASFDAQLALDSGLAAVGCFEEHTGRLHAAALERKQKMECAKTIQIVYNIGVDFRQNLQQLQGLMVDASIANQESLGSKNMGRWSQKVESA